MDDLIQEFLAESSEGLDRMERCLTELEQRPLDAVLLGEIFRAVHTIKGTTGFLGFSRLERMAHSGETLLGALRDGQLTADGPLISGLLQLMDRLRAVLCTIEQTGADGEASDREDEELVALLEDLQRRDRTQSATGMKVVAAAASVRTAASADRTLRIDVDVLNRMMNLVGELVLTRNQILQGQLGVTSPQLSRRLDAVTADLRETVMQARMQPVSHLFGKFPRMVRDLARSCGKEVRLEYFGESTGLDRGLLEAIKDPLTHAVRNAVDHGIEAPAQRLAAGKQAEGVVSLTAYHQSGWVVIDLTDDGAGIARGKVLAKALDGGLITAERAAEMTPREVLELIFLPGFSTASAVTTVSGRGVGMDVVRANVEGVGGVVELESEEGQGTLLRLRVPLTMAIVPALVVRSGDQSFCLPQGALAELLYVPRQEADEAVKHMGGTELYRLRDELLPMVWLDRLLDIAGKGNAETDAEPHGFYIAVLEAEGCRFGLVVDELLAPEEIVIKPLSAVLREIGLFSGATVLGNGTLALILDVAATAVRARVRPISRQAAQQARLAATPLRTAAQESFLVYETDACSGARPAERHALPLAVVERIETIELSEVERVGGRLVLQHRGALLALEDPGCVLSHAYDAASASPVTVLICEGVAGKQRLGLVVSRVVDVAGGVLLPDSTAVTGEQLALVKARVAVLHEGFAAPVAPMFNLREVA